MDDIIHIELACPCEVPPDAGKVPIFALNGCARDREVLFYQELFPARAFVSSRFFGLGNEYLR